MCSIQIAKDTLYKTVDLLVSSDTSLDANEQDFFKEMLYELAAANRLSNPNGLTDIFAAYKHFREDCTLVHRDTDPEAWAMMEEQHNAFAIKDGEITYRHRFWINRETGILLIRERPARELFKHCPTADLMCRLKKANGIGPKGE